MVVNQHVKYGQTEFMSKVSSLSPDLIVSSSIWT